MNEIWKGIGVGVAIALAQSLASTGALKWAWNKRYVYWIWGGGMMVRLLVFAATAFVAHQTNLHLAATLLALVLATMVFLIAESAALFIKK